MEGIEDMKKVFILESKGEILGMLTHTEKTYIEFQSEVEEVMKEGNTDFHTVKGILHGEEWIMCYLGMGFFLHMKLNHSFYREVGKELFVMEQKTKRLWEI